METQKTPFNTYKRRIPTSRVVELAARREAREVARRDNADGGRAARAGEPIPEGASAAFRAGYAEWAA